MKKSLGLIIFFLIFSNLISLSKIIKKVAIVSPEVNLILKDKQDKFNYRFEFLKDLTQYYPDDLLSEIEKNELDILINTSIQNIKKKLPRDIQYISESTNKCDDLLMLKTNEKGFLDLLINKSNYRIISAEQNPQYNEIDSLMLIEFIKQGYTTVNGLSDKDLIEFSGNVFRYSNINKKDVTNNFYQFLNSYKKDPILFNFIIENTNYFYVPVEYTKFHNLKKKDYQEICEKMSVDAVLKINYHFLLNKQYPWNPLESGYLYSISLIGEIELFNKKGKSIFYKTIEGISKKVKMPYTDVPISQNSFIITKQKDQIIITKRFGTGRYNYTFDNNFKELFIDSINTFKIELDKTNF